MKSLFAFFALFSSVALADVTAAVSVYSRGNDDAPENVRGNFETGLLYATIRVEDDRAEVQFPAFPHNHKVANGESATFCMKQVDTGTRKYLVGGDWNSAPKCTVLKYLDPKMTGLTSRIYFQAMELGVANQDGTYGGEFWIEVAPIGGAKPKAESDLNVKHKMTWQIVRKDGEIASADVQLLNPNGQNKAVTDTLRYRGSHFGKGTHDGQLKFESLAVRPVEPAFPPNRTESANRRR